MAIYEYQCKECKEVQEVRHGMSETPKIKCNECGGETAKVFSAPPIHFKGDGFYCTDNKTGD